MKFPEYKNLYMSQNEWNYRISNFRNCLPLNPIHKMYFQVYFPLVSNVTFKIIIIMFQQSYSVPCHYTLLTVWNVTINKTYLQWSWFSLLVKFKAIKYITKLHIKRKDRSMCLCTMHKTCNAHGVNSSNLTSTMFKCRCTTEK